MKLYVISLFDKFSFEEFRHALNEKGIPFNIKSQGDSVFPVLTENYFFGQIEVQEVYKPILEQIIPQFPNKLSISEHTIQPKPRFTFKRIFFISYAVVMTLLFLKYWDIDRKTSFDKHYNYVWNSSNTILYAYYHGRKDISVAYYDRNFDNNFEKSVENGTAAPGITSFYDSNEDGFTDSLIYKDKISNKLSQAWYNADNDRYFEKFILILEKTKDTMVFTDRNVNGQWEFQGRRSFSN